MVYIYGLVSSKDEVGTVGYIGITQNPTERLSQHRADNGSTSKAAWISGLRDAGATVDMVILDAAEDRESAFVKENAWILFGKSRQWPLTNGTSQGERRAILNGEFSRLEDVSIYVAGVEDELTAEKAFAARLNDSLTHSLEKEVGYKHDIERIVSCFEQSENQGRTFHDSARRLYRTSLVLSLLIIDTIMAVIAYMSLVDQYRIDVIRQGYWAAQSLLVGGVLLWPMIFTLIGMYLFNVPFYKLGRDPFAWFGLLSEPEKSFLWGFSISVAAMIASVVIFTIAYVGAAL